MSSERALSAIERALADSGLEVIEHELAGLGVIYFPPRLKRPQGLLVHNGSSDLALALAHHFLGHKTLPFYAYSATGEALYNAPREQGEAEVYAERFG